MRRSEIGAMAVAPPDRSALQGAVLAAALGWASVWVQGVQAQTLKAPRDTAMSLPAEVEDLRAQMTELDHAARLRMLVARMGAAQCLISSNLDRAANQARYSAAREEFLRVHTALHDGDLTLDIRAERNARVLSVWHQLDSAWSKLEAAYRGKANPQTILPLHQNAAQAANDLVAEMRAVRAPHMGPSGMQTALMVDLYQRQVMLAQAIIHQTCLIYAQTTPDDAAQKTLKETLPVFEGSLQAFISGMPSAGVAPPRDASLRGTLMDAARVWQDVAPLATRIANDNSANRSDILKILSGTETFMPFMAEAASLLRAPSQQL
ncbi:MAG: type IV pili methyl-accepting chemotaxis transducer N-terminal domain-containing protein [Pseudomonadota bacterium]